MQPALALERGAQGVPGQSGLFRDVAQGQHDAFLGAMYAGIVPVAVNTLLTADDYAFMLKDSRAQAAIVSHALLDLFVAALEKGGNEVRTVIVSHPEATSPPGFVALRDLLRNAEPAPVGMEGLQALQSCVL